MCIYLMGRPFTIQTDHRSLAWLDRMKDTNARLTRWSLLLQGYTFHIEYRTGSENGNADRLSRQWDQVDAGEGGRDVVNSMNRMCLCVCHSVYAIT